MNIPEKVKEAAKDLISMYGVSFQYLGRHKDTDFYMFRFPDGDDTGLPVVYELKGDEVRTISNLAALDIVRLFTK